MEIPFVQSWKVDIAGNIVILPKGPGAIMNTLDDASNALPGGAYTTFRTFHENKLLFLERHFHRLEESSQLIDYPISIDRIVVRKALSQVMRFITGEKRIRLTLDLEIRPGQIYITAESWRVLPQDNYLNGVKVTSSYLDRENPKAKLTHFINERKPAVLPGINDILMLSQDGVILEGLSSNFFAIRDRKIWTEERRALSGITRSFVMEIIEARGIQIGLEGLNIVDIGLIEEAFLTSSSRGILPVIQIDDTTIGSGVPGTTTKTAMKDYAKRIEENIESF